MGKIIIILLGIFFIGLCISVAITPKQAGTWRKRRKRK
jgi:uncharacterized alpha/beta hydrolase family protein